jgi:predicted membrane GTPase involved in stress response
MGAISPKMSARKKELRREVATLWSLFEFEYISASSNLLLHSIDFRIYTRGGGSASGKVKRIQSRCRGVKSRSLGDFVVGLATILTW